ncbi:similar to Saccharomyces cerevisiae YBR125C PTC4 Cytoplasmic type 2C protein phosphatase (PP2C) [Maudiozyma saulgeensis]|uniref:protein-serine/threonine phosphatase n=1 Tax=Maudiozyma saulgeensis TaxID=1789683 RepID=A0A1X7QXU7_9SACH|nr:similar to Saccharomyces cerevisiae YBR125C PTC4 Cytoplasmic type 2C protein phosphatase (PP2C) [Kazachstania saulgeensis]
MGQLLSHPLTEKTIQYNDYKDHKPSTQVSSLSPRFFNCIGSMQGYRLTQEDAHMIINEDDSIHVKFYDPFKDRVEIYILSLFAVFDGHGGSDCSAFLSGGKDDRGYNPKSGLAKWVTYAFENHHYGAMGTHKVGDINSVIRSKAKNNDDDGKIKRVFRTLEGLISQIFKDSYILQDIELYKHFANSTCGSTAVMAAIVNGEMVYVVNCGDSRCIISSKSDGIKTMSYDHKPQHIGELLRINDNGGTVSLGRVGGVLALSRAFSDFQFKRGVQYNSQNKRNVKGNYINNLAIAPQEAQVTVEPDVLMHRIDYKKDEFLVLACDGIWDVYSNRQLIRFIKYHLTQGIKLDGIIPKLLDHGIAQANSSTGVGFDNMTAIIVVLNKNGESLSDWYTKMKIRLEREKGLV